MLTPDALALGVDVGGTKLASGVVDRAGTVIEKRERRLTPSSSSSGLAGAIARLVADVRADHPAVAAVGIGIAGAVAWPEGTVVFAANHDHRGKLCRAVEDRVGFPVVVDNDANTAAWAELRAGDVRAQDALFLAVGTGVGSGFVVDGRLWRGRRGLGAELGHMLVRPDSGLRCECGRVGCLETVASAEALVRFARMLVRQHPESHLADLVDGVMQHLTPKMVISAALEGDPLARSAAREVGRWLGRGVASVASIFNFEAVVVGGGLSGLGELLLGPMRVTCEKIVSHGHYLDTPRITCATHGNDATMIGAGLLALDEARSRAMRPVGAGVEGGVEILAGSPT
ncbi:ROK family protein [Pseudonocardia sp.]|uniref:ROK family protein n=1 Tax=Pseudonocardia sp. TaxID=60912 RepID=UPI003D10EEF3